MTSREHIRTEEENQERMENQERCVMQLATASREWLLHSARPSASYLSQVRILHFRMERGAFIQFPICHCSKIYHKVSNLSHLQVLVYSEISTKNTLGGKWTAKVVQGKAQSDCTYVKLVRASREASASAMTKRYRIGPGDLKWSTGGVISNMILL